MIESLILAMLAGLSIAAPLGMNGIICIKLSLEKGFLPGLVSGLGNSTAVGFYVWLITSSVVAVESFLNEYKLIFHLFSGAILLLMGIKCFFFHQKNKKPQLTKKYLAIQNSSVRFLSIYLFALSIAMINPMKIVPLLAFISSDFYLTNNYSIFLTVLGFVSGTAIWWLILSATISCFRTKINQFFFQFINYSSGAFLVIVGLELILK